MTKASTRQILGPSVAMFRLHIIITVMAKVGATFTLRLPKLGSLFQGHDSLTV